MVSGGNGATDNSTQQSITIQDNDTVGLVISESSLVVSENGQRQQPSYGEVAIGTNG